MERRLSSAGRAGARALALALALAAAAALAPASAAAQGIQGPDTGSGCMALGNGPTVAVAYCTYVAPDGEQNAIAASLSPWSVYVVRCCSKQDPSQCRPVVGEDGGRPDPKAFNCLQPVGEDGKPVDTPATIVLHESSGSEVTTVHPLPGELVTVFLGPGAVGIVSVGQDESTVPGGASAP